MLKNKVKQRYILYCAVLLMVTLFLFSFENSEKVNARVDGGGGGSGSGGASTTPYYSMQFDYTVTTTTGVPGSVTTNTDSGTGYSTIVKTAGGEFSVSVAIYGSGYSGSGQLTKGGYIRSSTVNIAIISSLDMGTVKVTNSSGTVIGTGGKSLTLTGLSDGRYDVEFFFGSGGWTTSGRSGGNSNTVGTSSFYVDYHNPFISGASISTSGKSVNTSFTVTAEDSASGVDHLYMKVPGDSTWITCAASRTITAGSLNGLYQFYTVDRAGNTSATYYVYYDSNKPTINFYTYNGTQITAQATKVTFMATAYDVGIGIDYLQYMRPSDTAWQTYISDTQISSTSENGIYLFRAKDKAGNYSDTYSMILDTENPECSAFGENSLVPDGQSTNDEFITFDAYDDVSEIDKIFVKLPGQTVFSECTPANTFTANGTYYYYSMDIAGNCSDVQSVTLDNTPPTMNCPQTEFYYTTAYDFSVSASDNVGSATLYYKTPLMSDFAVANGNSYSVLNTQSDGKYYFYAVDDCGNSTEIKWIELNVAAPIATIEHDDTTNRYRITWDDSGTGMLNDQPYSKGAWLSTEGEYTFVLTNNANRSSTYHFTIAHLFVPYQYVDPTCEEEGYTVYRCFSCGRTYKSDYIDALGHDYEYELIGETCAEGAYYLYTCTRCGHTEKSDYLTDGGHRYVITVIAPTCVDRGYTEYICSVCGHKYRDDYIEATGHNFKVTVVPNSCADGGYTHYECKNCDYEYTADYIAAHGHNYVETVCEPTCTEKGHTLHKCSYCGDEYTTDETLALGHNYVERLKESTCEEDGCVIHTCTRCGFEYETDEVKALGHKYVSEVTMQATCDEDGNRHHICTRCGDQYDTAIPHFGHTFEIVDVKNTDGETVRTYKCEICGYTYTQDLGDQYDEVSSYVEYLFNQYSPYMVYVFFATAGVWSIAMGIAIIFARKNEEKEKAKKMLVNYVIGLIIIFVILVATPLLVRGFSALIAG